MASNNFNGRGTTVADNKPVGSAGQPFGNLKKEIPEKKQAAIKRRLDMRKKKESGKK